MGINSEADFSYLAVAEEIKSKIIAGDYQQEDRIPSERNLCDIYGVSRTTIRKAIDRLVDENFLVKRPGKGTYVINNTENDLETVNTSKINPNNNRGGIVGDQELFQKNNTGNIVFLRCTHHDIGTDNSAIKDDIFYPKVVAGIDSYVSSKNYHCIFKYVYEQNLDDEAIKEIAIKSDGIICGELHNKRFHDKLAALNLPIVLVNPSIISNEADSVGIDDFAGGYIVGQYLHSLGHSNLAFIGGSAESFPNKYRQQGFIEALRRAGIVIESSYIICRGWRLEDGYQATLNLLALKKRPTAIFAASDLLAIGAINAIKDEGLLIPDNISIIGFDDIEMAAQIRPGLSTMRVRKSEIGEIAAKLIFERLISNREYPVKVSIPAVLQERDSVKGLL